MASVHLKLVVVAIVWATSYPFGRYLASYEAPEALVIVRAFVAFLFLAFIAGHRRALRITISLPVLRQFLLLGLCGFCGHNYLLFSGLEHAQANTGAVINGAIPVAVVILDFLFFRQRVARRALVGIAISFLGAATVVTHGDLVGALQGGIGYGELLFVFAITGWAGYTIAARPLLDSMPVITVAAYGCLAGTVLMVPLTLANLEPTIAILSDPMIVALLIVQGLLTMGIGFLWYYEGVQQLGTMNAAAYTNLVPIFGVALAAATIGEIPDLSLIVGGALVIGGLWVVNRTQTARD